MYSAADPICVYHVLQCACVPFILQDDPGVVCSAMGLCVSQQVALAKAVMSNEIPQVDLNQRVDPFLLNIPQLLYPQQKVKETPKEVRLSHTCMFNGDSKCQLLIKTCLNSSHPVFSSVCRWVKMYAKTALRSSLTLRRRPKPMLHLSALCLHKWRASVIFWDLACLIW